MILLRQLREETRMDQHELSRRSGVSQSAISAIERGARPNPGIRTLEALAHAMGRRLADIYKPDEEPAA